MAGSAYLSNTSKLRIFSKCHGTVPHACIRCPASACIRRVGCASARNVGQTSPDGRATAIQPPTCFPSIPTSGCHICRKGGSDGLLPFWWLPSCCGVCVAHADGYTLLISFLRMSSIPCGTCRISAALSDLLSVSEVKASRKPNLPSAGCQYPRQRRRPAPAKVKLLLLHEAFCSFVSCSCKWFSLTASRLPTNACFSLSRSLSLSLSLSRIEVSNHCKEIQRHPHNACIVLIFQMYARMSKTVSTFNTVTKIGTMSALKVVFFAESTMAFHVSGSGAFYETTTQRASPP